MRKFLPLLILPALICPLYAGHRRGGALLSARDAKLVAERETSGIAVSARAIRLNGASGGWEVEIHMPREERGWRCIVDNDTRTVRTRDRIPNPPAKKSRR